VILRPGSLWRHSDDATGLARAGSYVVIVAMTTLGGLHCHNHAYVAALPWLLRGGV